MPTSYARRLTVVLASLAACGERAPGATCTNPDKVCSLEGAELLRECKVPPADTTRYEDDRDVYLSSGCFAFVPNGADCPDPSLPLDQWPSELYAPCEGEGRIQCAIALSSRRNEPRDTGDTDGPPPEDRGDTCYYDCVLVDEGYDCGRPLRDDEGRARTASPVARADWTTPLGLDGVPAEVRTALAHRWLEDARMEHASVASFARLALDLLAHGAPAGLIERVTRAQADEVAHAQTAYAIASALLGRAVGPGPLSIPHHDTPTLAMLAADSVRDGCVNEAIAAADATVRASHATQPVLRAALERVATDEARHAELAADIVAWAVATGGAEVAEAVRAAWEEALETPLPRGSTGPHAPELGLCDGETLRLAYRSVRDGVWAEEALAAG